MNNMTINRIASHTYSTVQLKLVVKTKFPFPIISPTCFTQFPQIGILVKHFSLIFPLFPRRGRNWFPRNIRPILCILHVSLKMRIPHYARQRILNLGNSGEIKVDSGEIRWKAFYFFFTRFPRCEIHHRKTWIPFPCHFISRSPVL